MKINKQQTIPIVDRCPVCLAIYSRDCLRILEQSHEYNLIYWNCPDCLSSTLALINLAEANQHMLKLLTDLSADEALRYKNSKAINIDDCLELFEYLSIR